MSTPTTVAAPAVLPLPPPGQPSMGAETRLAPPLPAPPADPHLFAAALLLLGVALSLVWLAAAKLRQRQRPGGGRRQAILNELDRTKARSTCPCRRLQDATGDLAASCQRPCADNVHALLAEFAAAATGLPCVRLTTQEMRDCESRLPSAIREAFACLTDTLAAVDLARFTPRPSPPACICLVDAAAAAVRDWPAEPAAQPNPAGSRDL